MSVRAANFGDKGDGEAGVEIMTYQESARQIRSRRPPHLLHSQVEQYPKPLAFKQRSASTGLVPRCESKQSKQSKGV